MDISTVPTDVLQGIASGQQGNQSPQSSQDLGSVPDDVLQKIASGQNTNDNSDSDGDLSSISDFSPMGQAPMSGNAPSMGQQSPLKFGDMLRMAALNSPEEQQNYLKSKFKFAEPVLDQKGQPTGNFNVGDDPTNLSPINTGSIGNTALGLLAKGAAMIPAIAGQMRGATMGAEMGSAAGPAGTVIGGILGAGAGAALGEGAKNLASSVNPGFDKEKAATDTVISGLFGMGGQALGEAVQFGAKNFIAPKVASALDGAIQADPKKGAFLAKVLNFIGGVNEKEAKKGAEWGFKKIYSNPANLDPDDIHNISESVTKRYAQKEGIAKAAYDTAESSFAKDEPTAQVKTDDMLDKMTDLMGSEEGKNGLGILHKTESSLDGMVSSFQFRDDIPHNVKAALPDVKMFFKRLGATTTDGGTTWHIPENANTSLSESMSAKKLFAKSFNNPNFNEEVGNVMKQGLYGNGATPLYPKGFTGLRGAIFDTAQATGHDSYIIANNNYASLMKARDGELTDSMGRKFTPSGWMDVTNPSSVSKYLKGSGDTSGINKLDYFHRQALNNLQSQIGGDFMDRASQWSVGQAMGKAKPQLLRLSVIGGLAGLAFPGSPMEKLMRVPAAFAMGSPTGVHVAARMLESGSGVGAVGNKILRSFSENATKEAGKATLSQLLSKQVRR